MKILPANELHQTAEYARGYFHVPVPNDTRYEDILRPGFWANHVGRLKPGALVDVVSEDLQLDIQLRVIRVDPGMVMMRVRHGYESEARREEMAAPAKPVEPRKAEPMPKVPDGYKVGHTKADGHYVKLAVTGKLVASKLPSNAAAVRAAIAHHTVANTPTGAPGAPVAGEGAAAAAG